MQLLVVQFIIEMFHRGFVNSVDFDAEIVWRQFFGFTYFAKQMAAFVVSNFSLVFL
jgi:hypothetical protein